jgi:hypothetical protein
VVHHAKWRITRTDTVNQQHEIMTVRYCSIAQLLSTLTRSNAKHAEIKTRRGDQRDCTVITSTMVPSLPSTTAFLPFLSHRQHDHTTSDTYTTRRAYCAYHTQRPRLYRIFVRLALRSCRPCSGGGSGKGCTCEDGDKGPITHFTATAVLRPSSHELSATYSLLIAVVESLRGLWQGSVVGQVRRQSPKILADFDDLDLLVWR